MTRAPSEMSDKEAAAYGRRVAAIRCPANVALDQPQRGRPRLKSVDHVELAEWGSDYLLLREVGYSEVDARALLRAYHELDAIPANDHDKKVLFQKNQRFVEVCSGDNQDFNAAKNWLLKRMDDTDRKLRIRKLIGDPDLIGPI